MATLDSALPVGYSGGEGGITLPGMGVPVRNRWASGLITFTSCL